MKTERMSYVPDLQPTQGLDDIPNNVEYNTLNAEQLAKLDIIDTAKRRAQEKSLLDLGREKAELELMLLKLKDPNFRKQAELYERITAVLTPMKEVHE